MKFEISKEEKRLLSSLKSGISKIKIYKFGLYPSVVSFTLINGKIVTIRAKEECVAHWFEVFPISISEQEMRNFPEYEMEGSDFSPENGVTILGKSEWTVPASDQDKSMMVGNTESAMVQFEGLASEISCNVINQVTLQTGIEISRKIGAPFIVASSMFPFALYVTDCDFSESIDEAIYERIKLC